MAVESLEIYVLFCSAGKMFTIFSPKMVVISVALKVYRDVDSQNKPSARDSHLRCSF